MERVLNLAFQGVRQLIARDVIAGQEDVGELAAALGLDGLDLLELGLGDVAGLDEERLEGIAGVPAAVARGDDAPAVEEDDGDVGSRAQLEHPGLLLDRDQLQDFGEAEVVEVPLERHPTVLPPRP